MKILKLILKIVLDIIKNFFLNSFWKSWPTLLIIGLSLVINGVLWYIYQSKIRVNPTPFYFSTGLILLNLILGNFIWEREKLVGYFLISIGLFTQFLMLILIRYMTITF